MADDDPTFEELRVASTAQDALSYLLARMATAGLSVTNWKPTGMYRSLLAAVSEFLGDLAMRIPTLAKSGLLDWAEGDWLTKLATSAYQVDRKEAVNAVVKFRLTNGTATPHNVTASSLWAKRSPDTGVRWRSTNTTTEVLAGSDTLDLEFEAEFAGSGYNISWASPGSFVLETSIPGVTIAAREVLDGDGVGLATYVVTTGAEAETDAALRVRCKAKWGSLAFAGPALSYVSWALEASDAVRKVFVDDTNPDGPGTVNVYVAGDLATAGAGDVADVDAVVQVRKPPTADVDVDAADEHAVTFAATAKCPAGQRGAARASIVAALRAYMQDLPISDGSSSGKLVYNQVIEILMSPAGVVDVSSLTLNGGTASITPAKGDMAKAVDGTFDDAALWLSFTDP